MTKKLKKIDILIYFIGIETIFWVIMIFLNSEWKYVAHVGIFVFFQIAAFMIYTFIRANIRLIKTPKKSRGPLFLYFILITIVNMAVYMIVAYFLDNVEFTMPKLLIDVPIKSFLLLLFIIAFGGKE